MTLPRMFQYELYCLNVEQQCNIIVQTPLLLDVLRIFQKKFLRLFSALISCLEHVNQVLYKSDCGDFQRSFYLVLPFVTICLRVSSFETFWRSFDRRIQINIAEALIIKEIQLLRDRPKNKKFRWRFGFWSEYRLSDLYSNAITVPRHYRNNVTAIFCVSELIESCCSF